MTVSSPTNWLLDGTYCKLAKAARSAVASPVRLAGAGDPDTRSEPYTTAVVTVKLSPEVFTSGQNVRPVVKVTMFTYHSQPLSAAY